MTPYNNQTDNVVDYLSSLNDDTITTLLDDLLTSDDVEQKMDICESIFTELEHTILDEEEIDTEWYLSFQDDLRDLVF